MASQSNTIDFTPFEAYEVPEVRPHRISADSFSKLTWPTNTNNEWKNSLTATIMATA